SSRSSCRTLFWSSAVPTGKVGASVPRRLGFGIPGQAHTSHPPLPRTVSARVRDGWRRNETSVAPGSDFDRDPVMFEGYPVVRVRLSTDATGDRGAGLRGHDRAS